MPYSFNRYFDYCKATIAGLLEAMARNDRDWLTEHDHWEEFTDEFVKEIKNARTFLDIGAGLGFYSFLALKENPDIQVIAVEADPARAAALHCYLDCPVYNVAAWSGTDTMMVDKVHISSSSIIGEAGISVVSLALDGIVKEADVVKCDIEGAELEAIKGLEGLIKKTKPVIFLEAHKGRVDFDALVGKMQELGYSWPGGTNRKVLRHG